MGSRLKRFSISLEQEILDLLDQDVRSGRFPTRSDAVRAMIRQQATRRQHEARGAVVGQISLVYDHHKRNLVNQILHIQHDTPVKILGAQHFHLDHHHCLESILVLGKAMELDALHRKLQNLRGLKHAVLSITAPAQDLK